AGIGAGCALCVCACDGDRAQPRDGGAQGKHHEAVGRAVPAGVPGGGARVPKRAVRRGASGSRVPADRAGPCAVRAHGDGDAQPVRRHPVGHVRGADRRAWADAVGQHWARCVDLRVGARDGARHCGAGQGKPHGAAAVVVHDAPPHGAQRPRRQHRERGAGDHRRGQGDHRRSGRQGFQHPVHRCHYLQAL
ncbi:hypothetical protein GGI23_002356, partial [Coemansia sp. RSA 2559]